MAYSRLLSADKLNSVKRTYLHDCKPIKCEREKIMEFWETLSISEKERVLIVYDMNVVDVLEDLINHPSLKVIMTYCLNAYNNYYSIQNATQMIKMPEKLILLEFTYFEDLADMLKDNHPILMKFLRTICLISNKVTNYPQEINLEETDIPDCTDCNLLQGKKRVLKFKIRALLNIFEILGVVVDSFCSGEKIFMRKRHYPSLYTQLISCQEQSQAISSEEALMKLYEILELLSIMFENNLIKAYNKANKHAAVKEPVSQNKITSAKEIKESVIEQEDQLKMVIDECKNSLEGCECERKQGQYCEYHREKIDETESGQEEENQEKIDLKVQEVSNQNQQLPQVSEKNIDMHLEDILDKQEFSKQLLEQQQKQQENTISKEQPEIKGNTENIQNHLPPLTQEEQEKLEEQQKRECLLEIWHRQFELEQGSCSFLEITSQNNNSLLGGDESIDPAIHSGKRQSYLRNDVEIINKRLCAVNLSNLTFKLIPNEQTSDSDEEFYEVDEKENFHYNIELKDYDIAEALGDGFKFEPSLYISNISNPQMFSGSKQQSSPFQQDLNQQNSYSRRNNNKRQDYYRHTENDYQSRYSDESPTDYDQQYLQVPEFIDSNKSSNHNNSHRSQQQSHRGNNLPGYFKQSHGNPLMQFPTFNNPVHPYQQVIFWGNNPSMLPSNFPKNSSNRSSKNNNNMGNNLRENQAFYDSNSINHNMTSGFPVNNQEYSNNNGRQYNLHNPQNQNYNYQSNSTSNVNFKNSTNNNYNGNNHNPRQFYSNYNISGNGQQQQQPNGTAGNQTKTHQKHKKRQQSKGKKQGDNNNNNNNNNNNMNYSTSSSEQQSQNNPISSNKGNSNNERIQNNQNNHSNSSSQQEISNNSYHGNQTKPKARSKRINPGSKHFEFNQISPAQSAATNTSITTMPAATITRFNLHPVVPQGNQLKRTKDLN